MAALHDAPNSHCRSACPIHAGSASAIAGWVRTWLTAPERGIYLQVDASEQDPEIETIRFGLLCRASRAVVADALQGPLGPEEDLAPPAPIAAARALYGRGDGGRQWG